MKIIDTRSFKLLWSVILFLFSLYLVKRADNLLILNLKLISQFILSAVLFLLFSLFFYILRERQSKAMVYTLLSGILAVYSLQMFEHPEKSFLWLLLFFFCCLTFYRAYTEEFEREIRLGAALTAFILSLFGFFGYQMYNFSGLHIYLLLILEFFGLFLFFYAVLAVLFKKLIAVSKISVESDNIIINGNITRNRSDLQLFFIFFSLILIGWIPYYIIYYPGTMSPDSFGEINQYTGISPLSNHHPIIHQILIRFCLRICELFYESASTEHITAGAGLYSALQMVILSAAFSFGILFLRKNGASKIALAVVFAFYALLPVNAFFSITMTKDVIFGGVTIVFAVLLIREVRHTEKTDKAKRKRIVDSFILVFIAFLFCTYRNNGYYAFLLGMPFFILINRKKWKRLGVLFIATVILVSGYKFLLFNVLGIQKSASRESLAVPLQQIARVIRDAPEELESSEAGTLREILPDLDSLGEMYDATYAGPVTQSFESEQFDRNVKAYVTAWLKLGLRHPVTYIEAFMMQNYGYWYPDVTAWAAFKLIRQPNDYNVTQNERFADIRTNINEAQDLSEYQQPGSILYSIGLNIWLMIISCTLLILKHQREASSVLLFPMTVWFTTLASPKYCEFRYIYAVIVLTPIIAVLAVCLPYKTKEVSNR